ncbi:hypothetical protein [Gracilibacillus timonensis]|uniref:hypothetical protein n=1 Tax=Gracilibacillus timonensis TaxID=1816696 RepID=UPI0008259218|nr:hypothetical protein [Gracilibacillus timonensis]
MNPLSLRTFVISVLSVIGCTTLLGCTSESDQIPVSGKIIVEQEEYEMITANYSSDGEEVDLYSVGEKSAQEVADDFENRTLPKNTEIKIAVEDQPSLTVLEWSEDEQSTEVSIEDDTITTPSKTGVYIYGSNLA